MAKKTNALKMLLEARAMVPVTTQQPVPPTTAHYYAQLRALGIKILPPASRRRIAIQIEEQPPALCVVKIIQRGSN